MNLQDIKLAIIGLGYVGLPLAVEFGKQRAVVGFDINQKRIDELTSGHDYTLETEPEELQAAIHLRFSTQLDSLRTGSFVTWAQARSAPSAPPTMCRTT